MELSEGRMEHAVSAVRGLDLLLLGKPMEERCHTCLPVNCKLSAVSCEPSVRTMQQ